MKTDAALSWKGLSLSAVLHGTVVAAAGTLFLIPAEVGTQEAPVTAEFQILETAPSSAIPPEQHAESNKPAADFSASEDSGELALENPSEEPVENVLPLSVPKEIVMRHPIPAGGPAAISASPSRRASPSVPHPAAVAKRGAKNLLPDYLENPPPRYPESSRLAGEQGVAMVRAEIAPSGRVCLVSLARSSGHTSLDRAAVEAVSRWKFHPASTAGIAMASEVTVPVRFELRQEQETAIRNP